MALETFCASLGPCRGTSNYPDEAWREDETDIQTLLRTDTTAKLKKNEFEYEGNGSCIFAGWNTKADGSGISLAGCASVTPASFGDYFYDPTDDPDAEEGATPQVTLYAQWTKTSTVERVTMYRLYNPNTFGCE